MCARTLREAVAGLAQAVRRGVGDENTDFRRIGAPLHPQHLVERVRHSLGPVPAADGRHGVHVHLCWVGGWMDEMRGRIFDRV